MIVIDIKLPDGFMLPFSYLISCRITPYYFMVGIIYKYSYSIPYSKYVPCKRVR